MVRISALFWRNNFDGAQNKSWHFDWLMHFMTFEMTIHDSSAVDKDDRTSISDLDQDGHAHTQELFGFRWEHKNSEGR